jgi:hypothetical protein
MSDGRATYTTLRFGGARADVALFATSGKPKETFHEARKVLKAATEGRAALTETIREPRPGELAELLAAGGAVVENVETGERITTAREVANGAESPLPPVAPTTYKGDPLADFPRGGDFRVSDDELRAQGGHGDSPAAMEYTPPDTVNQQGVTLADGTWLDLTAELKAIDERTKLDGIEVIHCIHSSSVPRDRIRGAHYLGGADPKSYKVLRLLWEGLREHDAAALVVYPGTGNGAAVHKLGIVVARGRQHAPERGGYAFPNLPRLILLECEWSENMRRPPARVTAPHEVEVSGRERQAAQTLVGALMASASVIDTLRDERLAKRAELLQKAREGKLESYEAPAEVERPEAGDDVADALLAAVGS